MAFSTCAIYLKDLLYISSLKSNFSVKFWDDWCWFWQVFQRDNLAKISGTYIRNEHGCVSRDVAKF